MTIQESRRWIVHWSLGLIALYGVFFLLAPVFHYPLGFDQSAQMLQIIFPIFLGYLATAIVFAFEGRDVETRAPDLLGPLTRGPFFVSLVLSVALFFAFWVADSTHSSAQAATPMKFDVFSSLFAAIVGIHTATTSALVADLFGAERH